MFFLRLLSNLKTPPPPPPHTLAFHRHCFFHQVSPSVICCHGNLIHCGQKGTQPPQKEISKHATTALCTQPLCCFLSWLSERGSCKKVVVFVVIQEAYIISCFCSAVQFPCSQALLANARPIWFGTLCELSVDSSPIRLSSGQTKHSVAVLY